VFKASPLPALVWEDLKRDPLVLIDVGASGGLRSLWRPLRPCLLRVGIEPDPMAFQKLQAEKEYSLLFPVALSDKTGSADFYLTRTKGRSSLLRPNHRIIDKFYDSAQFEVVDTVSVPISTLDALLDAHQVKADFLKIDTQGTAWEVLRGGEASTLPSALGVEIETEFLPRYEGQVLFEDVHRLLTRNGFALFGLQPRFFTRTAGRQYGWQWGQPLYTYALYFRELGPGAKKITVTKLVALAWLYGHLDYAAEVFAASRHLFSPDEAAAFETDLVGTIPFHRRLRIPGRYQLATWFWQFWRRWVIRLQWRT